MLDQYILDNNGDPVLEPDMLRWGLYLANPARRTIALHLSNGVEISTIFFGLNYRMPSMGPGPPILFETYVFGGEHEGVWKRYTTRDEAIKGHAQAVNEILKIAGEG